MKSKIIVISTIILASALVYFLFVSDRMAVDEDGELEFLNFDGSIFSDVSFYSSALGQADLPEIEIGESFDFNVSGIEIQGIKETNISYPKISTTDINFNISSPNIGITMPQTSPGNIGGSQEPPKTWTPNASDCAPFAAAPNCSYVPAENREMCEQCKSVGF